jgi:hypothetical protein
MLSALFHHFKITAKNLSEEESGSLGVKRKRIEDSISDSQTPRLQTPDSQTLFK